MKNIAILGSGAGSTAKAIIEASQATTATYRVAFVATTTPNAGILDVAASNKIPAACYTMETLQTLFLQQLRQEKVDLLVLAGFLKLLPAVIISGMHGAVVNTHPALLPAYGGKGMYGRRVHDAVALANEGQSGVTLHWVDAEYDRGAIIEQAIVDVPVGSTGDQVETLVRALERSWLPRAINRLLASEGHGT